MVSGEKEGVVVREFLRRMGEFNAYPEKVFRVECEGFGVYQNETAQVLDKLEGLGWFKTTRLKIDGGAVPFITNYSSPMGPSKSTLKTTRKFYELVEEQGHFADLCAYAALCKIHNKLRDEILGLEVLPGGQRPHMLNNPKGRVPDGVVTFEDEIVPIEVFNGVDYIGTEHKKRGQITDHASGGDHITPILIGRRCDDDLKDIIVQKLNGMVVHTDRVLWCETGGDKLDEVLETFYLDQVVDVLPQLKTSSGETLDGEKYDDVVTSNEPEDVRLIRPTEKMIPAAKMLPDAYIRRIRGGLQKHYIDSLYRRFENRDKRDAAQVLSALYNRLFWYGPEARAPLIDGAWDYAKDYISKAKSRKNSIMRYVNSLFDRLCDQKIIFEKDGVYYPQGADDPRPWLEV